MKKSAKGKDGRNGGGVVGTGLNKTLAPVHEALLKPRHVATLALIR